MDDVLKDQTHLPCRFCARTGKAKLMVRVKQFDAERLMYDELRLVTVSVFECPQCGKKSSEVCR